jgi:hypothetical protein
VNSAYSTVLTPAQQRLLESLPIPLAAVMMQQIARAGSLFPAEERELDRTLQSLTPPRPDNARRAVEMFATLRLSPELERLDWRSDATGFVDKMTAELWSTGQIGTFREAAKLLAPSAMTAEQGAQASKQRFVAIALDKRLSAVGKTPVLFRMLRPYGTFFPHADDENGAETLASWLAARANAHPEPYMHWQISGDIWKEPAAAPVVSLSYNGMFAEREKLLAFFNTVRNSAASQGPEGLQKALQHLSPEQIGMSAISDPVVRTFALDIFTQGSGTQLYATTFVQWTVREALRRTQPESLLAWFTPRCEATSMDWRLSHPDREQAPDGPGSLIDAEMGAYLSYVNLMRLPHAERASLLVWHEGYGQALLVGPDLPRGVESNSAMTLKGLLALAV